MNLIQQDETLISRQEEMLTHIEVERKNLAKQEELIKSRQTGQAGRVNQVRQEKMLNMREEQLEQERMRQERLRQEKLREEHKALREQKEAIKRRQEEIKELLLSALSDTGSPAAAVRSITSSSLKELLDLFLPPLDGLLLFSQGLMLLPQLLLAQPLLPHPLLLQLLLPYLQHLLLSHLVQSPCLP